MFVAVPIAICSPALAAAQASEWAFGAEIHASTYRGGPTFVQEGITLRSRPSASLLGAVRVDRFGARLGVGVGALLGSTNVAFCCGGPATIIDERLSSRVVALQPEVSWRLTSPGGGAALRLHAGPSIDVWNYDETRVTLGAHGAVSLSAPLSARTALVLRFGAGLVGRPFGPNDLEGTGGSSRSTFRFTLGTGIRLRL